ncbi:ABC transporter ATP-binding protein [Actinomyces trachealis]|uniref:ABC transporter ATP-binding protein n=1 Tax=Actinomyces trachealis TaxID=2763540 RepID=UPI0018929A5F|nr:ATP-binding cassette domain-containing protein [Actinomyces trachealis]
MLDIRHLSKRFGTVQALDDLSLRLEDGEIVGFVGANGAGKSTTMRIVMGVLATDEGTVTWNGKPLDATLRRRIGYMPEERGLYPKMKVGEQLRYLARLHGISKNSAQSAAQDWMERLGVAARAGDEVQKLSLGNQQRVQLAAALVGSPEMLVLDEPFSGLDPVAVDVMSGVLRERAAVGVPALFSSHQLDVVERLCDRVVIIRSGKLIADGTLEQLQEKAEQRWRVVVYPVAEKAPAAELLAELAGVLPVLETTTDPTGRLTITAGGPDEQVLLAAAQRLGTVRELGPVRRPLTEIFRDALAAPQANDDEEKHA